MPWGMFVHFRGTQRQVDYERFLRPEVTIITRCLLICRLAVSAAIADRCFLIDNEVVLFSCSKRFTTDLFLFYNMSTFHSEVLTPMCLGFIGFFCRKSGNLRKVKNTFVGRVPSTSLVISLQFHKYCFNVFSKI